MIEFLKDRKFDVKPPKGNPGLDAGIDLFCPNYNEHFSKVFAEENCGLEIQKDLDGKYFIRVAPHSDVLINSGYYTKFPNNIALIAFNKSGVATKQKLIAGACVDDASYEGLLHLHVINTSDEYQSVYCGNKVVQFVPVLIDTSGYSVLEDIAPEEFFKNHKSERGAGGFGSTSLDK